MRKVSVLIPIYNVQDYLSQCLNTVISQTFDNLQIILLDDGSTDNSYDIAKEFSNNDSRIELYHQNNNGVATTRNKLLSYVKGDYVLFVDSDDWLELNMIDFLISKIQKSSSDLVTCGMILNNSQVSNQYIENSLTKENAIERFLYHVEFRGSLWNKLFKTVLLRNIQFNSNISYGEDALFCWHYLQKVNIVLYTDKQLYHYRMNNTSISHSSFSSKKITAYYVWEEICAETSKYWPKYLDIANARHCIEDTLLLRNAAHCAYNVKEDIILLQNSMKKNRKSLIKSNFATIQMKIYSILSSYSYNFARLI